ncbi:MAG TPA: hypothetical protein VMU25_03515 [Candidatus Paceibacterota bacterium]|nr:hypothetical protein [Candidatus Paceibacterota bacterium]
MQDRRSSRGGVGFLLGFLAGVGAVIVTKMILMRTSTTRSGMRVESWILRAKAELLRRLADAEDMTEREFNIMVDLVTLRYGQLHRVGRDKIADVAAQLKARWSELKEEARRRKQEFADVQDDVDDEEY